MLRLPDGNEATVRAAADPADRLSHRPDRSALSLAAWTGHHPDDPGALGRVLGEQPDWTDVDTQQALVGVVAVLAQAGRLDAAVAAAAPAGDCLAGRFGFDPVQRLHLLAVLGWCRLALGHVEDADRYAAALRQTGLAESWPYAYGLGALLGGRCALAGGRMRRAVLLLSESLVPGEGHSTAFLRPYALTQLALAYALAGAAGPADRVLFDADRAVPARAPRLLRELAELTRAEILLARGRHSGALRTATGVADRCRADGQALAAVSALHLCARIDPSAQTAERLAAVVGDTDYPLARLQLRHAEAAAAGDGEALSEVAAGYDRTGLHWLAGETSAASLALAPPAHRARWVTADRSILERTAAQADVELPAVWSRGGDRFAPLTQREREITELAAGGWSSPRIAAHLQLSRRTIENHLQHSYRKLGVSSREELAAALGRSAATG
jgi:DNA-binding CsgD family transcriptional regulator